MNMMEADHQPSKRSTKDVDSVVFLVQYKETRSSNTTEGQLQVMNILRAPV